MHYTICESNWVHIWHIIADAFFDPIPLQFRYGKFVLISCVVLWFAFVKIQKRVYQIDSLRLCFTFVSIGFRICKEYILHAKFINKNNYRSRYIYTLSFEIKNALMELLINMHYFKQVKNCFNSFPRGTLS